MTHEIRPLQNHVPPGEKDLPRQGRRVGPQREQGRKTAQENLTMNNTRRNLIADLLIKVQDIHSEVDSLLAEEQEFLDNMPENFQNGEKGEHAQAAIDQLEAAVENLNETENCLDQARG